MFPIPEVHATGFNYQNEDEKVTLSFPSTLQKGKSCSKLPEFEGFALGKAAVGQQFLPLEFLTVHVGVCPLRVALGASGIADIA